MFSRFDWNDGSLYEPPCWNSSIRAVIGGDLFSCYTIQPSADIINKASGLNIIIYLNDFVEDSIQYYIPNYSQHASASRGARVHVHQRDTFPNVRQGFDVSPGTFVEVNLAEQQISRLGAPYGACTKQDWLDDASVARHLQPRYVYTSIAATARCRQLETIESCGCFNPYLTISPEVAEILSARQLKSCYHLNFTLSAHNVDSTLANMRCFDETFKTCEFEPSCRETRYERDVISTAWPHEAYEMAFYTNIINQTGDFRRSKFGDKFDAYEDIAALMSSNASLALSRLRGLDLIERNFIQLNVKFTVGNVEWILVYEYTNPHIIVIAK